MKRTAVGKYVLLETIDLGDETVANGFYFPSTTMTNARLGLYKVLSVGSIAKKEYGLEEGMIVFADRLACINWRDNTPFIDYKSIIYGINEETKDKFAFNNQVIVESDERFIKKSNNIFSIKESTMPLGTVTFSKSPLFKVGDIVMLPSGGDVVMYNEKVIHIYNDKSIHCRVEE